MAAFPSTVRYGELSVGVWDQSCESMDPEIDQQEAFLNLEAEY
jgi:hypothetical protein